PTLASAITATVNTGSSTCSTSGGGSCTASPTCGTNSNPCMVITHNFATGTSVAPWIVAGAGADLGGLSSTVSVLDIVPTSTNVATVTFSGAFNGVVLISSGNGSGAVGPTGPTGPVGNTTRVCDIVIGANNGAALVALDLAPQMKQCKVPAASTVVEIAVDADAGTSSVQVQKRHCSTITGGNCTAWTNTNLLSGALATLTGGFPACARTATSQTCIDGTTS